MKYRVIKSFPNSNKDYTKGDIINSPFGNLNPELWPEYFEEVKEPILTTEDGVKIYKGDIYWRVFSDWEYAEQFIDQPIYGKTINFSTQEAAKKYVKENKPMYSLKDIEKALKKTDNDLLYTTTELSKVWDNKFYENLKNNKNNLQI